MSDPIERAKRAIDGYSNLNIAEVEYFSFSKALIAVGELAESLDRILARADRGEKIHVSVGIHAKSRDALAKFRAAVEEIMTAAALMNLALARRHMLPMDGYCSCSACNRTGLQRDDMGSLEHCRDCLADADGYASFTPEEGPHQTSASGAYDYARGKWVFDHG